MGSGRIERITQRLIFSVYALFLFVGCAELLDWFSPQVELLVEEYGVYPAPTSSDIFVRENWGVKDAKLLPVAVDNNKKGGEDNQQEGKQEEGRIEGGEASGNTKEKSCEDILKVEKAKDGKGGGNTKIIRFYLDLTTSGVFLCKIRAWVKDQGDNEVISPPRQIVLVKSDTLHVKVRRSENPLRIQIPIKTNLMAIGEKLPISNLISLSAEAKDKNNKQRQIAKKTIDEIFRDKGENQMWEIELPVREIWGTSPPRQAELMIYIKGKEERQSALYLTVFVEFLTSTEVCNGIDDDGDGEVDENPQDGVTLWRDKDRDGWGDPSSPEIKCLNFPGETTASVEYPEGFTSKKGDCDDTNPFVCPSCPEICDGGIDNDCDGRGENDEEEKNEEIIPNQ